MMTNTFTALASPARDCWLVRVAEFGIGGTATTLRGAEPLARDLIALALERPEDEIRVEVEETPPLATYPIPTRWLSPSADVAIGSGLARAYGWRDYPGMRRGTGRYVDLFRDEDHDCPVGRLWTNDVDGCGLLHVN
ncbi:MAG: hypothetical protein ACRDTS_15515, partial [Mycobacterium sp.]